MKVVELLEVLAPSTKIRIMRGDCIIWEGFTSCLNINDNVKKNDISSVCIQGDHILIILPYYADIRTYITYI